MGRQSRQWPNQGQRLLDCRWGRARALAAVTVTACLIGGRRQRGYNSRKQLSRRERRGAQEKARVVSGIE